MYILIDKEVKDEVSNHLNSEIVFTLTNVCAYFHPMKGCLTEWLR